MPAYYNEFDPYAAQWLRNLVAAGHLPAGDVDARSILDVQPEDLNGYEQCHFFAGIGVWPYALRRVGWPDNRPVWTGSCPCQPFSAAGKQLGVHDERHLWPAWFQLIAQRRPAVVVGEQVATALAWLDIVSNDLEAAGYAFGAADLCAAGFPVESWHESPQHEWLLRAVRDCPDPVVAEQLLDFAAFAGGNLGAHDGDHIRQRLYFVGLADDPGERQHGGENSAGSRGWPSVEIGTAISRVEHREQSGLERQPRHGDRSDEPRRHDPTTPPSATNRLEFASGERWERGQEAAPGYEHDRSAPDGPQSQHGAGVASAYRVSGQGSDSRTRPHALDERRGAADWLFCRDGKWRPVEPGTFPLANAPAGRVGLLRAYGNALDTQTVVEFLTAVKGCAP